MPQVNGERHPGEVYRDFKEAVIKILGSQDNPPALGEGTEAPVPPNLATELHTVPPPRPGTSVIAVSTPPRSRQDTPVPRQRAAFPPVLWVIGGPGSNKAALCSQVNLKRFSNLQPQ